VVPIRIVELREVMRVLDVLEREPRLEPLREVEHLLSLELLERVELAREIAGRVMNYHAAPAPEGRADRLPFVCKKRGHGRGLDLGHDRTVLMTRVFAVPCDGRTTLGANPEAVRLRDPRVAHRASRRDLSLERIVDGIAALGAARSEGRVFA